MTRLTEVLHKSGGARNPKANHKKFMNYVRTYQHTRYMTTPVLKDKVGQTGDPASKKRKCVEPMQQLLDCWKQHDFKEKTCTEKLAAYTECVAEAAATGAEMQKFAASDKLGVTAADGKLNPKQANKLLRMYPKPAYDITFTHCYDFKLTPPHKYTSKTEDNTILNMKLK